MAGGVGCPLMSPQDLVEDLRRGLYRQSLLSGYPLHPQAFDLLERSLIVVGTHPGTTWGWRCLACLSGGRGDVSVTDLALAVHSVDCSGVSDSSRQRLLLMTGLTAYCQDESPAPWSTDVVSRALFGNPYWSALANQVGWPVGVFALDGWDLTLAAARARVDDSKRTRRKDWL